MGAALSVSPPKAVSAHHAPYIFEMPTLAIELAQKISPIGAAVVAGQYLMQGWDPSWRGRYPYSRFCPERSFSFFCTKLGANMQPIEIFAGTKFGDDRIKTEKVIFKIRFSHRVALSCYGYLEGSRRGRKGSNRGMPR